MDDSDYQYSDFESESDTDTAERGPGWNIRTHQGVRVQTVNESAHKFCILLPLGMNTFLVEVGNFFPSSLDLI